MLGRFKKLFAKVEDAVGSVAEPSDGPIPTVEEILGPPVLDYLSYGEVLTFRTSRILPVLEEFETTLEMGEGLSRTVTLNPRARRAVGEDPVEMEYTADVSGPEDALAWLRQRYGSEVLARGGQEERRATPRHLNRIRVRSRNLVRFQAVTHDLSTQGVRLIAEGDVSPGTVLDMDVQLDHDRLPDVKARGQVVWSTPHEEGRTWFLGLRFTAVTEQATLDEYVADLGGAAEEGLTRKNFLD